MSLCAPLLHGVSLTVVISVLALASPASASEGTGEAPGLPVPPGPGEPTAGRTPAGVGEAPPANEARQEPTAPRRYVPHGFTMELGLGLSHTMIASELGAREKTALGLAPLSLSVGGFVSPKVAIMARMAGTSVFRETGKGDLYQVVNGFYGATVQYWPSNDFFVGGGVGLAILANNPLMDVPRENSFSEIGYGATLRGGWAFATPGKSAFALTVELYGSKFESSSAVASALALQWQLR